MRWVILGDEWPAAGRPGGVGQWTWLAANALDARVFVRHRPYLRAFEGLVPVRGPSFGRWGGWWLALAARRAIAEADAVLCATWPAGVRAAHPRLHVVAHGSDVTRPTRDPRGRERVFGRARRWAVSGFLAGLLPPPARVLPSPVRLGPARRLTTLRRIGLVARATPLKGGDRFVRLVHAAGLEGVVAGDGPELPAWKALATSLGANVHFLGAVDDLTAFWAAIDACVLLPRCLPDGSGAEGLGLALLEAAAHGVPAIGCATGGVPEAADLVLPDPDDARGCAERLAAWWAPARGTDARDRVAAGHGPERFAEALLTTP